MQAYNRALLKHLMCGETQVAADVPDLGAEARRSEACETLLRLLPFSWFEAGPQDPLDHYCPPGCCASRTEAVSKVSACIRSVFFTLLPRIPALNKWNKMHQPAVWWLTACKAAGGIVAHCFAALSVELQDWAELPLLREDHAIGLDDKEAYRVRQGIRFRKAAAFLNDAVSAKRLAIAVVGMTACLPELGGFFNASRLDTPGNVIKWCHESSSPGVRALSRLSQLLLTPGSLQWYIVHGGLAWSEEALHICASSLLGLIGNTFLRTVLPFRRYPWRVGKLVHSEVGGRERLEIATEMQVLEPCCCDSGFTMKLVRACRTAESLVSSGIRTFILDCFQMCPDNNIAIEFRFSRARRQIDTCSGQLPTPATMSSNHVLAEAAALYDIAYRRFMERHIADAEVARAQAEVDRSAGLPPR